MRRPDVHILVLNSGSGSQKCSVFRLGAGAEPEDPPEPIWEATLDATDPDRPRGKLVIKVKTSGKPEPAARLPETTPLDRRIEHMLRLLWTGPQAALARPGAIDQVGHRVVHGGKYFGGATRITPAVVRRILQLEGFAPLHNGNNLIGYRVARRLLGRRVPQVAVFDTAFHRSLEAAAYTYAGPSDWLKQDIRRYGFHGTSFKWSSRRAAQLLGRSGDRTLTLVLCHLGGGCSLCATRGGRSIDTTMGFTPLDGIAMCTRSGAVDPGILIYLLRSGESVDHLEYLLNKESGLKGLSGLSGDTRQLSPARRARDPRAALAWNVFIHRLQAGIGQMIAALGAKPDALVFTDAISEDEPLVRAEACAPFRYLGLKLDRTKNRRSALDCNLATAASQVQVLLVKSREAYQIARECRELTRRKSSPG